MKLNISSVHHLIVTLIFTTVNLYLLTNSEELYLHADNIVSKSKDFYFCTEPYEIQEPEIYISKVTATVDEANIHHVIVYAYK